MKISNGIVLLAGMSLFIAGCASNSQRVTGTEGLDGSSQTAMQDSDRDGDSVPDADDVCAETDAQALVDSTGCEVPTGAIEGLSFGPNETGLSDEAQLVLDRYIDALQRNPNVVVSVEGHTDNRGPAAGNLELSKERVLSVVRYMVGNGISANRIKAYGYGESRPRAANATAEGREQNRRIEIKVLEGLL